MKTKPKPKGLYRLQKLRPKRYMNPFLCFAQEQRKNFKSVTSSGSLLSEWKAAHKGLGAKWRALANGNTKYYRQGKVPAFAMYVKDCPERNSILPTWRNCHKGLGARWKELDQSSKAKFSFYFEKPEGLIIKLMHFCPNYQC